MEKQVEIEELVDAFAQKHPELEDEITALCAEAMLMAEEN